MKTMSNEMLYHSFFYQGIDPKVPEEAKGRSGNACYYGNDFHSYATTVGWLWTKDVEERVFFYSFHTLSNTTSRTTRKLLAACPYESYPVPFHMYESYRDDRDFSEAMVTRLGKYLTNYLIEDFTRLDNRDEFKLLYRSYKALQECSGVRLPLPVKKEVEKRRKFIEASEKDDTLIKELRAKKAQRTAELNKQKREAAKKAAEEFAEAINNDGGLIKYLNAHFATLDYKERGKLAMAFDTDTFVWVSGDNVVTSKHIVEPLSTVKPWLQRWKKGDLKVGMHLGPYTIRSINDNFLQVGCHKFCNRNIAELYDAVFSKEGIA